MLVLGGVAWIIRQTGAVDLSVNAMLSVALITLGIGMVITARRAGGAGLVCMGIVLTLVLATSSASVDVGVFQEGFGDRIERPTTLEDVKPGYRLGVGDLTVDLSTIDLSGGTRRIDFKIAAGSLTVIVPEGPDTTVTAKVGVGDLTVFGSNESGSNIKRTFTDPGTSEATSRFALTVEVGAGDIEVVRAGN